MTAMNAEGGSVNEADNDKYNVNYPGRIILIPLQIFNFCWYYGTESTGTAKT